MNTYDEEATQYQNPDSDATQIEDNTVDQNAETTSETTSENDNEEVTEDKNGKWKRAAVGAGTGLLIGGVAGVIMGMSPAATDLPVYTTNDNHRDHLTHPELVDDKVQVATSVTDDMSFSQAFAAARAEVGPGGCFEWHGQLYGTYTAEEWNNMTPEQRAEWSDHFNWNHIDHSSSDVAQHSTTAQQQTSPVDTPSAENDEIEIVSVDHSDVTQGQSQGDGTQIAGEVTVQQGEPEIEILGVVHDEGSNTNVAGMTIDGEGVILIDVDNDQTFDYLAADANQNGEIEDSEIVDIQAQNLTVADLGGFTNSMDNLYADNSAPDYSNEGIYEG